MSVLIDKSTRLVVQGLTGREGTFHAKQAPPTAPPSSAASRPARAAHPRRLAGVRHGARRGRENRRERVRDFRPAAVCGRRDHGSGRRGHRAGRVHHRGHPDARHDARDDVSQGASGDEAHRPQLPGHHFPRQGEGRHHSRPDLPRGAHRDRVEERHPDLRSDPPAHPESDSARRRASGSAAIRSSARRTSMPWSCSATIPTPTRW